MTDVAEITAASRAKQGLPPTVTDPATLERVAALLVDIPRVTRQNAKEDK